ncbi:terminase gpA endonuclease subunit [Roseiconus lacunae]|uniref:terminase gpA endonuclease subunit n=1 Tax=Roseiconus lacunae TaxID=2605694 RepID=UPI001E3018E5|nr:terminase gpA endonuclease subunit [Roseiconus lacunae]MCD0460051.1 phage terminase large subunit family protein [Roseiconus lacunae]
MDPLAKARARRAEYAERERQRVAKTKRAASAAANDIGELPEVADPVLKERCRLDLALFLKELFPHTTGSGPLGPPQMEAIKRFEYAVLNFARNLTALPRGYVKSTISENSLIWAKCYGHRRFPLFVGATQELADDGLRNIKTEYETNDHLLSLFPEVCYPIRKLEGKPERAKNLTYRGERLRIVWVNDSIVLPWIGESAAKGVICESYGITSPPRGKRYRLPDGSQPRPDFCVFDDPQTDESAESDTMTRKRIKFIKKGYLRMGGHGRKMSAVMNATQLEDGDLVDQMSDRKLHKDWSTVRTQMVTKMPTHLEEWWLTKYADIRHDYDDSDIEGQAKAAAKSTEFYIANWEIMNEGAEVSWPDIPLEEGEYDALQHAMNILVDEGPEVFYAECQNDPRKAVASQSVIQITDDTAKRQSGLSRGIVPDRASDVVFGIDVHDNVLYWTVAAASQSFTGGVIDYGTWPEQPNEWFTLRNARVTLRDQYPGATLEDAIQHGIEELVANLCAGPWMTSGGQSLPIGCGLVDAGHKPDEVHNALRHLGLSHVLSSKGLGITASRKPMEEYDLSEDRVFRVGPDLKRPRWYLPRDKFVDGVYRVHFDTNWAKNQLAARLTQPLSADGAWEYFGNGEFDHGHYNRHMQGERSKLHEVEGRKVDVWGPVAGYENHWFDTAVMCVIALSMCGCVLPIQKQSEPPKKPRPPRKKRQRDEDPDAGDFWITAR